MSKVPMLHELLAVEGDRTSTAAAILREAQSTFTGKRDHFLGTVRKVEMFDADRSGENTSEYKEVVTSVDEKLTHVWNVFGRAMDVTAAKEATNASAHATADVIYNGEVLFKDVPATVLLNLEKKLLQLRELYNMIPTLDPTFSWVADPSLPAHVYRTQHPQEQLKTEKTLKHKVLYEATDKHPAQIEKFTVDVPVGKITQERHSGMVSVYDKALWLDRITSLLLAVKEARQRANKAEVVDLKVAEKLRAAIHAPA